MRTTVKNTVLQMASANQMEIVPGAQGILLLTSLITNALLRVEALVEIVAMDTSAQLTTPAYLLAIVRVAQARQ